MWPPCVGAHFLCARALRAPNNVYFSLSCVSLRVSFFERFFDYFCGICSKKRGWFRKHYKQDISAQNRSCNRIPLCCTNSTWKKRNRCTNLRTRTRNHFYFWPRTHYKNRMFRASRGKHNANIGISEGEAKRENYGHGNTTKIGVLWLPFCLFLGGWSRRLCFAICVHPTTLWK